MIMEKHLFVIKQLDALYNNLGGYICQTATEDQIAMTEKVLSISIPSLLRSYYKNVANGGFGPLYGIYGVHGGFYGDSHGGIAYADGNLLHVGITQLSEMTVKNQSITIQPTFRTSDRSRKGITRR
jgi:hypothetical protein